MTPKKSVRDCKSTDGQRREPDRFPQEILHRANSNAAFT